MSRTTTIHLEGFAQGSLDRLVTGIRRTPDGVFRTAVLYYLADEGTGRLSWRVPQFRREPTSTRGVDVAFDAETWAALEEEAQKQQVTPEALAVHALLYLLADLDSGRLADRLGEELG